MRILVTGGLGFIGSHLVDLLVSDIRHEVTILDNKSSNVINFDDRCEVLIESVDKPVYLPTTDIVFHLASVVGPAGVLQHSNIGSSIINGTKNLIQSCIENNSLFINISTSEIYGHSNILREDSDKVCSGEYQVRTEYGMAKLLAEIMTVNKAKVIDLKYQIIRPFNVAGPRQLPDGGFVLPRFVIAKLTDQPITIFGDGLQIRAFTDVRDVCDAIVKIAFCKYENEIWNVGNAANEMSINELAVKVAGEEGNFIYVDPQKLHGPLFAEAENKVPYTEKIETKLGWVPKISLSKTIADTMEYYRRKIDEGYEFDVCKGKNAVELI
jgi:nucleoside-diphosphate-sugar epimerase